MLRLRFAVAIFQSTVLKTLLKNRWILLQILQDIGQQVSLFFLCFLCWLCPNKSTVRYVNLPRYTMIHVKYWQDFLCGHADEESCIKHNSKQSGTWRQVKSYI